MAPLSKAAPGEVEKSSIAGAVKSQLMKLVVASLAIAGSAYFALPHLTTAAFPNRGSVAALAALATLIFGIAGTVLKALLLGGRVRAPRASEPSPPAQSRTEPVLPSAPTALDAAGPTAASASAPALPHGDAATPRTHVVSTMADLVERILAGRQPRGGHRTLITGRSQDVDCAKDAIALSHALAQRGATVVLIDWSTSGQSIEPQAGIVPGLGLNDLLAGVIRFDEAVRRLPHSNVHYIGCGAPLEPTAAEIDPDHLNLILDALDETYEHIIVTGTHDEACFLFELIQGRFDAGIAVADKTRHVAVLQEPPGSFLGFEVADIDIMRFERDAAEGSPAAFGQRIQRVARQPAAELQRRAS